MLPAPKASYPGAAEAIRFPTASVHGRSLAVSEEVVGEVRQYVIVLARPAAVDQMSSPTPADTLGNRLPRPDIIVYTIDCGD